MLGVCSRRDARERGRPCAAARGLEKEGHGPVDAPRGEGGGGLACKREMMGGVWRPRGCCWALLALYIFF